MRSVQLDGEERKEAMPGMCEAEKGADPVHSTGSGNVFLLPSS
jgi:hypothetical protein